MSNIPLTVYKASAGSGKTFTLAIEYISLLVRNPESYKTILAVTFTNKATEEMKMRIISQLYGISRRLEDSNSYLQKVMEKTGMSEENVIERASIALSYLVHNYNYFRVETIDAFFQSVLRNLARELDLTPNLRIDLNDYQVEEMAVDELIDNLDQNPKVLKWIREYIAHNIQDDRSWNVIGDIKKFGRNIFRDFYKKHADELDELMKNDRFFTEYTKELRLRRDAVKNSIVEKAKAIITKIQEHGLDDYDNFLYGHKGCVLQYIRKVAGGNFDGSPSSSRISDCISSPDKWANKKSECKEELIQLAANELCAMLQELEDCRIKGWRDYQSAVLTLNHLNQLRLLHAIAEIVDDITKNANRFQLSNTQNLLHQLMKDTDSPFVFEKIGAQLRHMMIDEFQDTSRIQWENFKVLLDNCMAQSGSHNLIVGDVKQSIYRWRSGDWRLLNDIDKEFSSGQMKEEPLQTNYRSFEKIIQFNNAFFQEAVSVTANELKNDGIDAYEDLCKAYKKDELEQCVHQQNGQGYISVKLLPSTDYHETVLSELLQTVENLHQEGVEWKEMAILMRSNKEIQEVADLFMRERPNINIISDEAFRLDASLAVNILIDAFRLLAEPDDQLVKARLVKAYNQQVQKTGETNTELLIDNSLDSRLPDAFVNGESLRTMPLMDLADYLYELFQLHTLTEQSAYVCAFYDLLNDYLNDHATDISHFLTDWDETFHKNTIQCDEQNGIRIISIHKSKGLEFDHVIIPMCDWPLELGNTIWAEKKTQDPYDKLPIIPVDFSQKKMMGTVYEEDYKEEHLQNVVDNMNMLYVAFTRASKSLIVTGKRMSKKRIKEKTTSYNRSEILEEALPALTELLEGTTLTGMTDEKAPIQFEWGDLHATTHLVKAGKEQQQKNPFTAPMGIKTLQIRTYPASVDFRQSNKSKEFVRGEDEVPTRSQTYIKLGNVLHALFSTIRTTDDIEPKLKELELEGVIYDEHITADSLRKKLTAALSDPRVKDWFSPQWTLYNECTILVRDAQTGEVEERRPDRVMHHDGKTIVVDFKFGVPQREHLDQVREYMSLLQQMGHEHVEGYLWYVLKNEIKEVK